MNFSFSRGPVCKLFGLADASCMGREQRSVNDQVSRRSLKIEKIERLCS